MSKIVISALGSFSPLGASPQAAREGYESGKSKIRHTEIAGEVLPAARVSEDAEELLSNLAAVNPKYKTLDRSVQLAIAAARVAAKDARITGRANSSIGVNIGSSRGATDLLERSFSALQRGEKLAAQTSPVTTLGNVSSWVAQDLMLHGLEMSHSVTCSTGLHALLNAIAWIRSGMAKIVLAGATEAPLTPFTIAQMKALRIYSRDLETPYPCRPLGVEDADARDGLVLGEAAVIAAVENCDTALARNLDPKTLIEIESFGFAMESIRSPTAISEDGTAFEQAMRNALSSANTDAPLDCVVLHAPGTLKGDRAELEAVGRVFPNRRPFVISNKWIVGHTFAAAGLLGIELARLLLNEMNPPQFPYPIVIGENAARPISRVMVNAAGFGGNTVSVILKKFAP